jgi:hypothetical protein
MIHDANGVMLHQDQQNNHVEEVVASGQEDLEGVVGGRW